MSRAIVTLQSTAERERAIQWINKAPTGSRVEFKGPCRSVDQNSRFWAMLTDVAVQGRIEGRRYNTEQWKLMFLHAYAEERGIEIKYLPRLQGVGMVPCGRSSSDLSVTEMSELMEYISAWGVENGIKFHDQEEFEEA
ncbi:recombination protein NinB [Bradyrhizobium sp. 61]|uniref:recombination protein NinB n=1 Tax=Bradyrhizobium sp. 61 TaxID=2782679 RepID=UPI001FFA53B5|nr:recombination protein NinB [Bradyrhizobium sp. 61]MCK1282096.1 recombination protein NinB [Bradyrhizobium sp. 61]